MSFSLDVNILLYASDRSSTFHAAASSFLDQCAQESELCYLAWPTLMSYLRIATHPRIFTHPLAPSEAVINIQTLFSLPHVRTLSEEDGFLETYQEVTSEMSVRGNLVPDAHLVALLRQHDIKKLYTADTDFRKFSWLDVRNPFA
ncbi:MAG: ribonuclease VapC [Nitrospirales bacterium]|nr:MAG: ribonuclease VapC [Nitrospirales bacterium]